MTPLGGTPPAPVPKAAEPPADDRALIPPTRFTAWLKTRAAWILLLDIALVVLFAFTTPHHVYATTANAKNVLLALTEALLLALGLTMMLGAGIFDLSLGANLVLSSVVGAKVMLLAHPAGGSLGPAHPRRGGRLPGHGPAVRPDQRPDHRGRRHQLAARDAGDARHRHRHRRPAHRRDRSGRPAGLAPDRYRPAHVRGGAAPVGRRAGRPGSAVGGGAVHPLRAARPGDRIVPGGGRAGRAPRPGPPDQPDHTGRRPSGHRRPHRPDPVRLIQPGRAPERRPSRRHRRRDRRNPPGRRPHI